MQRNPVAIQSGHGAGDLHCATVVHQKGNPGLLCRKLLVNYIKQISKGKTDTFHDRFVRGQAAVVVAARCIIYFIDPTHILIAKKANENGVDRQVIDRTDVPPYEYSSMLWTAGEVQNPENNAGQ